MPKFFIKESNVSLNQIVITGDDVNHIKNVLRLKQEDTIILSDGCGKDYIVKIDTFESDAIKTTILESKSNNTEPPIEITLFQGIPKSDKMDFIIQKSVELGVKKIVPVMTERTIIRFENHKDKVKKVDRWQKIVLEAAKQCNRGMIPTVEYPVSFNECLELAKEADLGIIPYEKEMENGLKNHLKNHLKNSIHKVAVIIGPEGGFAENEIKNAVNYNIKPVTLGPRILRTETAGITVLSILMYELGDVGK